jgi:hypothetical protein
MPLSFSFSLLWETIGSLEKSLMLKSHFKIFPKLVDPSLQQASTRMHM